MPRQPRGHVKYPKMLRMYIRYTRYRIIFTGIYMNASCGNSPFEKTNYGGNSTADAFTLLAARVSAIRRKWWTKGLSRCGDADILQFTHEVTKNIYSHIPGVYSLVLLVARTAVPVCTLNPNDNPTYYLWPKPYRCPWPPSIPSDCRIGRNSCRALLPSAYNLKIDAAKAQTVIYTWYVYKVCVCV